MPRGQGHGKEKPAPRNPRGLRCTGRCLPRSGDPDHFTAPPQRGKAPARTPPAGSPLDALPAYCYGAFGTGLAARRGGGAGGRNAWQMPNR